MLERFIIKFEFIRVEKYIFCTIARISEMREKNNTFHWMIFIVFKTGKPLVVGIKI